MTISRRGLLFGLPLFLAGCQSVPNQQAMYGDIPDEPHPLKKVPLEKIKPELRRQEVQTWKKVIRVISHELNNSLAPIASLAHSGGELVSRPLGHLFGRNVTRLAVKEGTYLRGFVYSFIEMLVPGWDKRRVEEAFRR